MKYVVTGGSGFIGSHLVELLKNKGDVVILDRESPSFIDIADCKNNNKILDLIQGADYVFHLAAETSVPRSIENPLCYNYNNVNGIVNVNVNVIVNVIVDVIVNVTSSLFTAPVGLSIGPEIFTVLNIGAPYMFILSTYQ